MQTNNEIEISVLKGDKLFNQNTPLILPSQKKAKKNQMLI